MNQNLNQQNSNQNNNIKSINEAISPTFGFRREQSKFVIIRDFPISQNKVWTLYEWFNINTPLSVLFDFIDKELMKISQNVLINNYSLVVVLNTLKKKSYEYDRNDVNTSLRNLCASHFVEIVFKVNQNNRKTK